jgi:hypothetical protein
VKTPTELHPSARFAQRIGIVMNLSQLSRLRLNLMIRADQRITFGLVGKFIARA